MALAERFLAAAVGHAALYVMGDLFEAWLGDDAPDQIPGLVPESLMRALSEVSATGTELVFMHGNRDFLLGKHFAESVGGRLVRDDVIDLDLGGVATRLLHGDTLCTDDVPYQQLRTLVRSTNWQQQFLSLSVADRMAQAEALRKRSQAETADKSHAIMDVNAEAVENEFTTSGCQWLIHGHTHRPDVHPQPSMAPAGQRLVLGDWHDDHAMIAYFDGHGLHLHRYTGEAALP